MTREKGSFGAAPVLSEKGHTWPSVCGAPACAAGPRRRLRAGLAVASLAQSAACAGRHRSGRTQKKRQESLGETRSSVGFRLVTNSEQTALNNEDTKASYSISVCPSCQERRDYVPFYSSHLTAPTETTG